MIFDEIIKKDVIKAYEKTWYKFIKFNNHDFQQTLWKQIKKSLKNETRTWSWKEDKRKHIQKIKSIKEKIFEKWFY